MSVCVGVSYWYWNESPCQRVQLVSLPVPMGVWLMWRGPAVRTAPRCLKCISHCLSGYVASHEDESAEKCLLLCMQSCLLWALGPEESCWQDMPGGRGDGVDWASWIGRGASPSREAKRQLIRGKGEGRAWRLSPLWSRKSTARLTRQKWAPEFLLWGRDGSMQIRSIEMTMGQGWVSPGWAVVVTVLWKAGREVVPRLSIQSCVGRGAASGAL